MRTIIIFLFFCGSITAQSSNIVLDKINLITILFNYETGALESGNISTYDCSSCTNDSLPFVINYQAPGDFGGIQYFLANNVKFFDASIIWMGQGEIIYPENFSISSPFVLSGITADLTNNITYFDMNGTETNDLSFISLASNALDKLKYLEISQELAPQSYKIGVFKYAPRVGMFDPSVAKWVVFLYVNTYAKNELKEGDITKLLTYPNPVNSILHIPTDKNFVKLKIFDLSNKLLLELENNSSINVEQLDSGLYTLIAEDENSKLYHSKFCK